jgi:hypothetical protein
MFMLRQGDVLLVALKRQGWENFEPEHRELVLAVGEGSGHSHVLHAPALRRDDIVYVLKDGSLVHERPDGQPAEHQTITVPRGVYRVVQQREWIQGIARKVRD